jgi:hypothetical protein
VEKPYHIVEKDDSRGWASFLAKNGQALLPRGCLEFRWRLRDGSLTRFG